MNKNLNCFVKTLTPVCFTPSRLILIDPYKSASLIYSDSNNKSWSKPVSQ